MFNLVVSLLSILVDDRKLHRYLQTGYLGLSPFPVVVANEGL